MSGGTVRSARHRRSAGQSDSERATIAASLQMTCPRWLIMWSRWHRTYTAFACFTPEPVIVDEAMVDAFLARIQQVERDSREPFGRISRTEANGYQKKGR